MTKKNNQINGNKPATQKDLSLLAGHLTERLDRMEKKMVTKSDLKAFATKSDLKNFATKSDLKAFATKSDLKDFATKSDLKDFATKSDLKNFATRESQERILSIVESIDNHFKEHRDIPRRVEKLELDAFKLKTRQR